MSLLVGILERLSKSSTSMQSSLAQTSRAQYLHSSVTRSLPIALRPSHLCGRLLQSGCCRWLSTAVTCRRCSSGCVSAKLLSAAFLETGTRWCRRRERTDSALYMRSVTNP
ncbi:Fungal transcriptional regulatory protein, N-terminal [Penicillium camemberti]|uniref:Fungal transcriptional regulatory protein, N-terminal n=1 Tax=Penicillium camemberti (strain FM 013) TaxID=1429867 RepID=A0A0G4PL10_PENC3|nr:Fungal transcriptional regulatory protein, N-terminal [Penicillium camemberti]